MITGMKEIAAKVRCGDAQKSNRPAEASDSSRQNGGRE